jgi:hypothetical protein
MSRRPKLKLNEAIEEIRTKPTVPLWPHLGLVLDMSRGAVYQAAAKNEIECVRYGHRIKAVTAPLRRKL